MFRCLFIAVLASVIAVNSHGAEAPGEFYINRGNVTNAQVNAVNFINEGRFVVDSLSIPWSSLNTVNFTNRGTMIALPGFRFDTVVPPFGFRRQATNFFNAPGAFIVAEDSGGSIILDEDLGGGVFNADASYLQVNARNITNHGNFVAGASGLMQLFGESIDLTGGTLFVEDVTSSASSGFGIGNLVTDTNFIPSLGVYDLAWGVDVNTNMAVGGIIGGVDPNVITTPPFNITNFFIGNFEQSCETFFTLDDANVWVRDERLDLTNRVVQVIAVQRADTNIQLYASFYPLVLPRGNPQGGYLSSMVEFRVASTNFRTLTMQEHSFYVFDQLGSQTNYTLSGNAIADTFRPGAIVTFRSIPGLGENGMPGVPFLDPNLFNDASYSNRFVTNQYAVYSAEIESIASRIPRLPDVGVTNLPGRVEVNADELVLLNTRIRGEGLISLKATNFVGGENNVLDVPRVSMNFSTRSNILHLQDMTPDRVERFGGYLQVYSGIWTNVYEEVVGTNTNVVEVRFHLTAVDGRDLHTTEPVIAQQLQLTSTNGNGSVIYSENLSVTNFVGVRANDLTLAEESRLYLAKGVGFSYTNINIGSFTNLGFLQVNELADIRRTEQEPLNSVVNRGSIAAFGTDIFATYFENTGDILSSNYYGYIFGDEFGSDFLNTDCFGRLLPTVVSSSTEGAISINAETARIDSGTFSSLGDVKYIGNVFKMNNHQVMAGGRLVFDINGILTDTGERANNRWIVQNGFEMSAARPAGDLLGTEIRSVAGNLAFVQNRWGSEDRGATINGFTDNLAIGRLAIDGSTNSLYQFLPSRPGSALYVDVLEINGVQAVGIRQFTNTVQLRMNVYFGNVESTNANFTAERLNRILGTNSSFNFYWVTNWAGPNSSVDVPLTENGPVRRFNRALRESINFDSDGDGLPNRYDPFPFPAEAFGITGITVASDFRAVSFGVNTTEGGVYIIEYKTNVASSSWQTLRQVLQNNASGGVLSITDQIEVGGPQRYYRVRKAQ